ASAPSRPVSAGWKSLVDSPCRYSSGSTSATCGDRRTDGGRIRLRNVCFAPSTTRRSSTRGARTSRAQAPTVTFRGRPWPSRAAVPCLFNLNDTLPSSSPRSTTYGYTSAGGVLGQGGSEGESAVGSKLALPRAYLLSLADQRGDESMWGSGV